MKKILFYIACLFPVNLFSQFSDGFDDGIFHGSQTQGRDVEWIGDTDLFTVDESLQLRLNATESGKAQLKTALTVSENAFWECRIKLDFNPTSQNYAGIYLVSDAEDLTSSELNGLSVRVGYTGKNVCLVRHSAGQAGRILIEGEKDRVGNSSNSLYVKATVDRQGVFNLYSKREDESDYFKEGSCILEGTFTGRYFGLLCTFTKTRGSHFFFDDFTVRELRDDEQGEGGGSAGSIPEEGDVFVSEIMFNPPSGGGEWIEVYNDSEKDIDLRFLSVATRKSSDGSLNKVYPVSSASVLFRPAQYLVITEGREGVCSFFDCADNALFAELDVFPALHNESGTVVLLCGRTGDILDEVPYSVKWHSEGISNPKGVSLERSAFDGPSDDPSNWYSASSDSGFATPGRENSARSGGNAIEEVSIEYPNFETDDYRICYRFDRPGLRCRSQLFDSSGRLLFVIADNLLLGSEGCLRWRGDSVLSSGIFVIYLEVYDTGGYIRRFKRPVVLR
ncbi:MAG: lamin tail domain-containing protein [Dysgonamonadaceae bacterium]|jgi:hypothetical protein|nr:lamin tail domain-containing protein [Dysgonamonadaceae bacterium]